MESLIYLDTHVAFWLYAEGGAARLSAPAAEVVRAADEIRISPAVRLELEYLSEVHRIGVSPTPIIDELSTRLGLIVCPTEFLTVVHEAERQTWTRDPFDRLIVAQAALHDARLVTKDSTIHAHYERAIW